MSDVAERAVVIQRAELDRERRHDHARSFHHLAHNLDKFSCAGSEVSFRWRNAANRCAG
jgi:hypothetical protein